MFTCAPPAVTGWALRSVGHSLWEDKGIPKVCLERFRKLWNWRVKSREGVSNLPDEELAAFVSWFASGRFDDEWALPYLQTAIDRSKTAELSSPVLERLADITNRYPEDCLKCVRSMLKAEEGLWVFDLKDRGIWRLLKQAVAHQDPNVRDEAIRIINLIGAKGYLQYRELLPPG